MKFADAKNVRILFFLLTLVLFAEDWDAKFAEVCKRDAMCSRLKASDGTWFRPKPEIIALLKNAEVQAEIKNASLKYGVDPTAVAGAIVAENSLNVGVKDSVQTWLAGKMGITSIAGKNFSFGLGQIQLPAAREAESYIAKLEGRNPKSDAELTQEIADPMGSIRIAATIVRKVQDDYKNQGFDISKDPGVLASLYNLGQSERRAKEAKTEGRLPQVNYFGLFVNKYAPDIKSAAKVTAPQVITNIPPAIDKPQLASSISAVSKNSDMTPPPTVVKDEKRNKNLIKTDIVTKSVPLVSSPLLCESASYGQDIAQETKSSSFGAPVGALEKDESYSEISRALDCKSNVWKLIKGRNGNVGWIQDEQLEKVKGIKLDIKFTCTQGKAESSCKQSIEKSAGDLTIAVESKNTDDLVYLKPISNNKEGKISFKNEDFKCGNKIPETTSKNKVSSARSLFVKPNISAQEIKSASEELSKFSNKELARMSTELNIPVDQLKEPENPYTSVVITLEEIKASSQHCLRAVSSETLTCQVPIIHSKQLQELIEKVRYEKEPNLSDIDKLNQSLTQARKQSLSYSYSNYSTYAPNEDELKLTTPELIKESILDCNDRINTLNKSAEPQQKQTVVSTNTPGYPSYPSYPGGSGLGYGTYLTLYNVDKIVEAAKKASDEQIQKYSSEFISFAKFCHARLNLLEPNKKDNKLNCTQAPKYLTNSSASYQLFSRDLVAKIYQQHPLRLLTEINMRSSDFVYQNIIYDILGVPQTQQPYNAFSNDPRSSYCPNKTAEYIEDLVKNNPCIKHVYVPTRYLSNKLNNLDSKVIYRQFEDDDRYAVEIGDGSCK